MAGLIWKSKLAGSFFFLFFCQVEVSRCETRDFRGVRAFSSVEETSGSAMGTFLLPKGSARFRFKVAKR